MISSKLACGLAAIGILAGCSSVPTYTFPPRDGDCVDLSGAPCAGAMTPDQLTHEVPETFPDTTYTYVVSLIGLPEATSDPDMDGPLRAAAAGFDVDGLDSYPPSDAPDANCEEFIEDFVALTDPNHVGVDNALQGLVGTIEGFLEPMDCPGMMTDGCLDATLQRQIEEGSLLLIMEVSGVNDFSYDSAVTLQLHLAETTDMMPPMVSGGGGLAGGQTFNSTMVLGDPVAGDIFAGRLRASTPLLPLVIDTGGFMLTLMITQAQVRFNITATTLDRGAIGGVVTVEAIVEAASVIAPGMEMLVRQVVETIADVDPSAADPAVCTAMSLGLTFSGVEATVN
mgnify:CR=1 FL=1